MQRKTLIALILYFAAWFGVAYCMLSREARADNWFAEIGAGYQFLTPFTRLTPESHRWHGSNPTAVLAVGREWDNGFTLQYQHISNWLVGPPFNNDAETSLDHVALSYKWRW